MLYKWYKQPCQWGITQSTFSLTKWASAKNKWVWTGIATISDDRLHCKEYIITKYVFWRILRWITSACPSLIAEKNCSSHSEFILYDVSHQVSAQRTWFERWCVKNSKMAVQCWTLFDILMEWFQLFCVTYLPAASHQVSAQDDISFERRWCLKNSKMAV